MIDLWPTMLIYQLDLKSFYLTYMPKFKFVSLSVWLGEWDGWMDTQTDNAIPVTHSTDAGWKNDTENCKALIACNKTLISHILLATSSVWILQIRFDICLKLTVHIDLHVFLAATGYVKMYWFIENPCLLDWNIVDSRPKSKVFDLNTKLQFGRVIQMLCRKYWLSDSIEGFFISSDPKILCNLTGVKCPYTNTQVFK